MKKGQMSADLLVTLVIIIITITLLSAIILNYSEAQERSRVQQQLQYTANKTASIITTTQALEDTKFNIEVQLSKITYTDEKNNSKKVYPTMTTNPSTNSLTLSLNVRGIVQTATAQYYTENSGATPNTTIIPGSVETTGKLVIKRE